MPEFPARARRRRAARPIVPAVALLAALVALLLVPAAAVRADEGGPDGSGYRYIDSDEPDGPNHAFDDISGSGTPLGLGDDDSSSQAIGFGFEFYGQTYSDVSVSSNGYLNFDNGTADHDPDEPVNQCGIPDATGPNNAIHGFWDDLDPSSGGEVYVDLVVGDDDPFNNSDRFVVQYDDVPIKGSADTVTFQVVLVEDTDDILLVYQDVQSSTATSGGSATIGLEGPGSLDTALLYDCNTAGTVHNGLTVRYSTTLADEADLRVTLEGLPDRELYVGEIFTYYIIVDNLGPSRAHNVVVQEELLTEYSEFVRANGCSLAVRTEGGLIDEFDCNFALSAGVFDLGTFGANWLNPRSTTDLGRLIITLNVEVMQQGQLNGFVTAMSDTHDPDPTNSAATHTTTALPAADLAIIKTGTPDPVTAGDTLTYDLEVTNQGKYTGAGDGPFDGAGGSDAGDVTVTDPLPAGVSVRSVTPSQGACEAGTPGLASDPLRCDLGIVPDGDTATVSVEVAVDPDRAPGIGALSSTATVTSAAFDPNTTDNSATVETEVVADADLALSTFAIGTPVAGTTYHYEYSITNAGPSTARNVMLRDFLPSDVEFLDASIVRADGDETSLACTLNTGSNSLFCPLARIAPTTTPLLVFANVRIPPDVPDGTLLANDADVFLTDTPDSSLANNTDSATTGVVARADLAVQQASRVELAAGSSTVTYTVLATNHGPSDAQDVEVVEALPAIADVGTLPDGCTHDDVVQEVTCDLGTLPAGTSVSREIPVVVDGNPGPFTATATVSSATTDPDAGNDSASTVTDVDTAADLAMSTSAPATAVAGEAFTLEYEITNDGPDVARNLHLRDDLPDGVEFVGATLATGGPAGAMDCTVISPSNRMICPLGDVAPTGAVPTLVLVDVHVPADTADGTPLDNAADVLLSDTADPAPGDNTSTSSTTVETVADVGIRTVSRISQGVAASVVAYRTTVGNDGPSDAQDVIVEQQLPGGVDVALLPDACDHDLASTTVTCALGTIAVGDTHTLEFASDVAGNPGTLVSTATVTSSTTDPNAGNDTATDRAAVGGATLDRLAGATRFGTAATIALAQFPDGADTVYLARADEVVDAVAGGVLTDGPILLVPSCGPIPDVVTDALAALDADRVVALGGTSAVCHLVLAEAAAISDASTGRLAGADRYGTATAIALAQFPDGADTVYLARADDVVDAVAGGVLTGGPILLVPTCGPIPDVVADALAELGANRVVALGGTTAICDELLTEAAATTGAATGRIAGETRIGTAAAIALTEFQVGADTAYLARADDVVDAVAGGVLTGGPILLVPTCGPIPDVVATALAELEPDRIIALGGDAAVCEDVLELARRAARG